MISFGSWKDRVKVLKRETFTLYLACRHPRVPWYAKLPRADRRRLRIEPDRSDPGLHPRAGIPGRPGSDPARAHARDPSHPRGCPRGMPSEIGGNRRKGDPCGEDRGCRDRRDLAPHRGTRRLMILRALDRPNPPWVSKQSPDDPPSPGKRSRFVKRDWGSGQPHLLSSILPSIPPILSTIRLRIDGPATTTEVSAVLSVMRLLALMVYVPAGIVGWVSTITDSIFSLVITFARSIPTILAIFCRRGLPHFRPEGPVLGHLGEGNGDIDVRLTDQGDEDRITRGEA